jgi:hypothetical protein
MIYNKQGFLQAYSYLTQGIEKDASNLYIL